MRDMYKNLHKKYSLAKTLRFELKPEGKTLTNIKQNGILKQDEHRAEIYKDVKKYCDEYHRYFIDQCMSNFELDDELMQKYYELYNKNSKNKKEEDEFSNIQEKLRKEISNRFTKSKYYNGLFKSDIIQTYLMEFYKDDLEKIEKISEFKKFTTYFKGYNTNRANMYVDSADSTAISYRLINENLPIFISNLKLYTKIKSILPNQIIKLNKELEGYIQVDSIDEIFTLKYFNETLTQKGIEIYNIIISGKSEENNKKIKGLNEYINEYNQKNKTSHISKFRQLYKQILSEKIGASFVIDAIDDDQELITTIKNYYQSLKKAMNGSNGLISMLCDIDKYDTSKIFINNDLSVTKISKDLFDDWDRINSLRRDFYDENYVGKSKVGSKKYEEDRKKLLKNEKQLSIKFIDDLIIDTEKSLTEYIKNYISKNKIIENIETHYKKMEEILNKEYLTNSKELIQDEDAIQKIKMFLDEVKLLQNFAKLVIPKDNTIERDLEFYNIYEPLYDVLSGIIPLYNKARNYLTQKPYSNKKIKLNFESPTLLDGWDISKEQANLGVILMKEQNYYLGIINPYNRKIFVDTQCSDAAQNCYKKIEYKLLPGPNKMLPKVLFSKKRIDYFNPSEELLAKYKAGLHKKGENFDLNFCHELIDFYKQSIEKHPEWKEFKFKFRKTADYNDISEFYKDVERQGYKIEFQNYSEEYINSLVEIGDLYLFKIYNKDFSPNSKGKPNLHTMYWKAIFDENNLKNVVYKLNGEAEVFYRKASLKLENTVKHEKNKPIQNKNINNPKKESIFEYDLIKDKRYTEDKFQLHVPITLNFINEGKEYINEDVNRFLKYNDVNVIGIDRGERNLLYVTVINPEGKILEQFSLNEIVNEYNGVKHTVDYHKLLDEKEKEREKARESWKTIENIKELKEGYMSQVIHKIVALMDKYKAIIVIEDLNNGFKNSRIKVEKQVYQKFEKMLIDKLNYLVFKDKPYNEEGGLYNAYQLTNKFDGFNKMGRQTGILFYIPAWCTSKIDPVTGFVNLLNLRYTSVEKAKTLVNNFDDIKFNETENYFEFYIDYSKLTNRPFGSRKKWTICTYGKRIENYRNPEINNNWDTRTVNLTNEFSNLFDMYDVNYGNLKKEILEQNDKKFWIAFLRLLKLTLQMRNSIPNTSTDYLISPIKDKNGNFYYSNVVDSSLPKDADANGAYNIARKGLMCVKQIRETDDSKLRKIKFKISNQEWLEYVQEKNK